MVRVVTDSTADIPPEMAEKLGITVVPSYIAFGSETYQDGVDLTKQQFYDRLNASRVIPTTAAPPIGAYEEVFHRLAKENPGVAFFPAKDMAFCSNMKKINLLKVLASLEGMVHKVQVAPEIADRARGAIERMIKI